MILLAPVTGAVLIVALVRSSFSPRVVVVSFMALPAAVVFSPSPPELAATIAIEALIVNACARIIRVDALRATAASCFVNAITQPLLWLSIRSGLLNMGGSWWSGFLVSETLVSASEAAVYWIALSDLRRRRNALRLALAISVAANAASALVGLMAPF